MPIQAQRPLNGLITKVQKGLFITNIKTHIEVIPLVRKECFLLTTELDLENQCPNTRGLICSSLQVMVIVSLYPLYLS